MEQPKYPSVYFLLREGGPQRVNTAVLGLSLLSVGKAVF